MVTSESDPSGESGPSTSRSESSDSVTFIFSNNKQTMENCSNEPDSCDNFNVTYSEWNNQNIQQQRTSTPVQDTNHFINNTVKRKITVLNQPPNIEANANGDANIENLEIYSSDSLDEFNDEGRRYLELLSDSNSCEESTNSERQYHSQVIKQVSNIFGFCCTFLGTLYKYHKSNNI